jgi:hypothetical protein
MKALLRNVELAACSPERGTHEVGGGVLRRDLDRVTDAALLGLGRCGVFSTLLIPRGFPVATLGQTGVLVT